MHRFNNSLGQESFSQNTKRDRRCPVLTQAEGVSGICVCRSGAGEGYTSLTDLGCLSRGIGPCTHGKREQRGGTGNPSKEGEATHLEASVDND